MRREFEQANFQKFKYPGICPGGWGEVSNRSVHYASSQQCLRSGEFDLCLVMVENLNRQAGNEGFFFLACGNLKTLIPNGSHKI